MNLISLRRCGDFIINRTNRFLSYNKFIHHGQNYGQQSCTLSMFFRPTTTTLYRSFNTTPCRHIFNFNKPPTGTRPLPKTTKERNKTTLLYLISAAVATVGASYAAVPLYRVFCQSTNYGGTVSQVNRVVICLLLV